VWVWEKEGGREQEIGIECVYGCKERESV